MLLAALTAAFGLLWGALSASAHSGFQSYVYVSIFDDALEGRVEYPIDDLGPVIDLDFPPEADDRLDVARSNADRIIAYTDLHLDLGDGEVAWELAFDSEFEMLETEAGDYLQVPFEVLETFDDAPRTFVATYSGIIESNPERDALFLVENDWGSATFGNEGEHLLGFSVGAETQLIDVEEVSMAESMTEVARRGSVAVDRSLVILTTLVAVLAGAVLGNRRTGRPSSVRSALERLGARLTWFVVPMVAVTAVLGLSSTALTERTALGIGAIGTLLAASSVVVPPATARLVIGGAGAAAGAVLAQTFVFQQLDRSRPILAFIGFALGVIATVAFVTVLLLPLALLIRRWSRAGLVAEVLAAGAGLAGAVWLVERVLGVKFPLRTAELTVADAITSPILVAVLTAIAAALAFRQITRPPDHTSPSTIEHDRDADRIEA